MACSPPRSRSSSRSGKRKSSSASGLLGRVVRPLVGKAALAAYGVLATAGSMLWVPQLEALRNQAINAATGWVQQVPAVRQASHWWGEQQERFNDWRGAFQEVARQSRDAAHPQASGSVSTGTPGPKTNDKPAQGNNSFAQCAEQLPPSAPLSLASVGAGWKPVVLC